MIMLNNNNAKANHNDWGREFLKKILAVNKKGSDHHQVRIHFRHGIFDDSGKEVPLPSSTFSKANAFPSLTICLGLEINGLF